MKRMLKPTFSNPCIWLWVYSSKESAGHSEDFVKRFPPEYKMMHSVYRSAKNKHLDDTKTRALPALVFLLFLLKRRDDRASQLCPNVRKEFSITLDVPYYSDVGRYMEVKYCIYTSELKMVIVH